MMLQPALVSPEALSILTKVQEACQKHNVYLDIVNEESVYFEGSESSGFFSDEKIHMAGLMGKSHEYAGMLSVGIRRKEADWVPLLVHEFQHLLQWSEDAKVWTDAKINPPTGTIDKIDALFQWIDKKIELTPEEVKDCVQATMNVESDCEMRTSAFLTEHNFPIDKDEYLQKASSYVLFYRVILEYRAWYKPDSKSYADKAVWGLMPAHLNDLFNLELNAEQWTALKSCAAIAE